LIIAVTATAVVLAQPSVQDEYAVYELLAPASGSFKTVYDVSVIIPGAKEFSDTIGSGLTPIAANDDGGIDLMTGAALKFEVESRALRIHLARAVPPDGGQARLRITKTYKDPKSYSGDARSLTFNRRVPLPRAAIVLPAGFRLLECNIPSQVL